jgi:predicted transcriptional regulator
VNKLEENNYIKKIKNKYHINPMAKIYFNTLMEFKNSVDIINDFNSFWYKHDLNQLSIDAVKNITDLKDSKLIETTPLDIYKTHNTIKKQLIESTNVISLSIAGQL